MKLSRVKAVVLRQVYLYAGSPQRILPIFAWVALDILLWGFITLYLNSIAQAGINFVPMFLGAVLLWNFLTRVMQGVSIAFLEDVWSRNFLNYFASPLMTSDYLAGIAATGVGTSIIGLVVMVAMAWGAFGLSFLIYGVALLPFLLILFLTGIAFGFLGASIVLRLGPASEWLVWPIPTLLTPFVGVFYPLAILPPWMQAIGRLLPPSYVFEAMRAIVAGEPVSWAGLAVGAALAVAYVVGACFMFALIYRYVIRTGLIARYSAESAS